MVKCFVTGDNHIGKPYELKLSEIRNELTEARFESLQKMVNHANEEECDLFIVTGDLFEKTDIKRVGGGNEKKGAEYVQRVVEILKDFKNSVLVLPGNHDYENGDSSVWNEFNKQCEKYGHILVLNEFKEIPLGDINGNEVFVYPAYCQTYLSKDTNNLDWIKNADIQTDDIINIGVAHGTIEDLSCDNEGVYFKMTRKELRDIPVDVWFIGHAHIPDPREIPEDKYIQGHKIYNAGTHQQTDIGNNSFGYGFIVKIDKKGKDATINAKKWRSGTITFHEIIVNTSAESENAFREALEKKVSEICSTNDPQKCVIRVKAKGSAKPAEYERKDEIYDELTQKFFFRYPAVWSDFSEEITSEKIAAEFREKSLISIFLNSFIDDKENDPDENRIELNMAYQLIKSLKK